MRTSDHPLVHGRVLFLGAALIVGGWTLGCAPEADVDAVEDEASGESGDSALETAEPSRTVTREFQQALVAGIEPVRGRILTERPLDVGAASSERIGWPEWAKNPGDPDVRRMEMNPTVAFADVKSGTMGTMEFDMQELEALADSVRTLGIGEPVSAIGEPSSSQSEPVEKSWSNAYDSRIDLSGRSGAQYDRIGQLSANGGCTGTLIGRRLVITAAHCIINGSGQYIAGTFSADITPSSLPYGTQNVVGAVWGGNYIGCNNWATCMPEDWAVLILEDDFHNPSGQYAHPGWMGWAWDSNDAAYTNQFDNKRLHGYPGCSGNDGAPACTYPELWGQTFNCTIGSFMYPFSNGYETTFSFGCDGSPGQSGSAVLDIDYGYVLGVYGVGRCAATSGSWTCANETNSAIRANPNLAKRLDWVIGDLITNLRVQYP